MALSREGFDGSHEKSRSTEKGQSSGLSWITIGIASDLYNSIKAEASQRGQSIDEYISSKLYSSISSAASTAQRPRPVTPEAFARIMAARQKILEDTHGEIFEDSTELLRRMRSGNLEEPDQL